MPIFKILAILLHYPDQAVQEHGGELIEALELDSLLEAAERAGIAAFVSRLRAADLLDAQAAYVETFDHGRARSLHLFEHVHGESRDRGTAMIELLEVYRDAGFAIAVPELPDYLPLFLEFLSTLAADQALAWLGDTGHLIQMLHARLVADDNPYSVLLAPLVRLAGLDPADDELCARLAAEPPDDTAQALDRAWDEAPVTFGPAAGCGRAEPSPIRWHDAASR
ncbi:MAG TPA: nitrate reductase molybdenum cofactor assembly chaperone [Parasulfuritortus sp.]